MHSLPRLLHPLPYLYEPVSALSHLTAALLFLGLGLHLLRLRPTSPSRQTFLAIYALSCVTLFLLSGLYHTVVADSPAHNLLLRLDHAAIFVLIAGTFTPIHGILFRGPLRYAPLILIWSAALSGVVLKTAYIDAVPESLSLTLYLSCGWFGLVGGSLLWYQRGFRFILPLLLGGIAYSAGAAIDFLNRPNPIPHVLQAHELFHFSVIAGALLHYTFIRRIAQEKIPLTI